MKKWQIGLVLLAFIILVPYIYVEINKIIYKNKVLDYLTEEQHYEKQQIAHIEGLWGKKLPAFYVDVVFADEPNVRYTYFAHNRVHQFEYTVLNGEQLTEKDLLHYEARTD